MRKGILAEGGATGPSAARRQEACSEVPGTGLSHSANHYDNENPLRCSRGAGVVVKPDRIRSGCRDTLKGRSVSECFVMRMITSTIHL
jgi:hypothetical protein